MKCRRAMENERKSLCERTVEELENVGVDANVGANRNEVVVIIEELSHKKQREVGKIIDEYGFKYSFKGEMDSAGEYVAFKKR